MLASYRPRDGCYIGGSELEFVERLQAIPECKSHLERLVQAIEYNQVGNLFAPVLMWPVPPDAEANLPTISRVQTDTLDFRPAALDVSYLLAINFGAGKRDLIAFWLRGAGVAVLEDSMLCGEIGLLCQRPSENTDWQK